MGLPDIHVYEARSNYWVGQILKQISGGESLYLTTHEERPWGFTIHFDAKEGVPKFVQFNNAKKWTFCSLNERQRRVEWPLVLKDVQERGETPRARVDCIYSDSMSFSIVTHNACMNDLLIWHYEPKTLD